MSETKTITLPSGKTAEVRRPKGKQMREAAKHTNPHVDMMGYKFALISRITTIDGKAIVPEDVDEMSLDDIGAIMETVEGNWSAPETSST